VLDDLDRVNHISLLAGFTLLTRVSSWAPSGEHGLGKAWPWDPKLLWTLAAGFFYASHPPEAGHRLEREKIALLSIAALPYFCSPLWASVHFLKRCTFSIGP